MGFTPTGLAPLERRFREERNRCPRLAMHLKRAAAGKRACFARAGARAGLSPVGENIQLLHHRRKAGGVDLGLDASRAAAPGPRA